MSAPQDPQRHVEAALRNAAIQERAKDLVDCACQNASAGLYGLTLLAGRSRRVDGSLSEEGAVVICLSGPLSDEDVNTIARYMRAYTQDVSAGCVLGEEKWEGTVTPKRS